MPRFAIPDFDSSADKLPSTGNPLDRLGEWIDSAGGIFDSVASRVNAIRQVDRDAAKVTKVKVSQEPPTAGSAVSQDKVVVKNNQGLIIAVGLIALAIVIIKV